MPIRRCPVLHGAGTVAGDPACSATTATTLLTAQATSMDANDDGQGGRKVGKLRNPQAVERHVRLYRWLLESPAYRGLSSCARCLLVELKALYNGTNSELFLSVRDTAARAVASPISVIRCSIHRACTLLIT
jgi:hypothetical protein